MSESRHREAFEEFADSVRGIDGVEEIILFGSVARGEEREEADYEPLVDIDEERARESVKRARNFLEAVQGWMEDNR